MADEDLFKKGSFNLNEDPNFNFQLNRIVMWNDGDVRDLRGVGATIKSSSDWIRVMTNLARQAEAEGRIENAVGYWRMSEFFMDDGDRQKVPVYQKASEMFFELKAPLFAEKVVERFKVPFEGVFLPVFVAGAAGKNRGSIVLHGGNDSYGEELFAPMIYLARQGFDVYVFEGPGQGSVLRLQGMKLMPEWERPVSAILDFFGLTDVTLVGVSLGGFLALRAAAHEKRIRRAVGWSIFPDFFQVIMADHRPLVAKTIEAALRLNLDCVLNALLKKQMGRNELMRWNLTHGMFTYGAKTPSEYLRKIKKFSLQGIGQNIDQDVLVIGAREDHFIVPGLFHQEYDLLQNARSLSFRLFTDEQDAGSHCNLGNTKLVLDAICRWIDEVSDEGTA